MKIKIDTAALGRSKWYEYAVRFVFGGIVTALTGIVAKRWGAGIGGLFLAFPAIFPATATLLEKHERQEKEQAGEHGRIRGHAAAGVDAAGAAMGSVGLAAFAVVVWLWIPTRPSAVVLCSATLAWFLLAVLTWEIRQHFWRKLRLALFRNTKPTPAITACQPPSGRRRSDE
ncbi:MAG: DUF3147 family protein [Candidatus Korobacteraceae bacterium]